MALDFAITTGGKNKLQGLSATDWHPEGLRDPIDQGRAQAVRLKPTVHPIPVVKRSIDRFWTRRLYPIAQLRHDDKQCYVWEGFGGQPMRVWPVVGFFEDYVSGREQDAFSAYSAWCRSQFDRYRAVPKAMGGMFNGSLFRLVARLHDQTGIQAHAPWGFEDALIDRAIQVRVKERFALVESIKERGFIIEGNPILCISGRSCALLRGGHHRVAALLALGETRVPELIVRPRWLGNRGRLLAGRL